MKRIKVSDEDNIQFGKLSSLSIDSKIYYNRLDNVPYNKGYILNIGPSYFDLNEEEKEIVQNEITKNDGVVRHCVHIINNVDCCGCTVFNKEAFDKEHDKTTFSLNDVLNHISASADCHCKLDIEVTIKTIISKNKRRIIKREFINLCLEDDIVGSKEEIINHVNEVEKIASKLSELKGDEYGI